MEAEDPAVSWVLPLYRTAPFLKELITRIASTSVGLGLRERFEVILVDDACPEGSGTAAEELAQRHTEIKVVRLSVNGGQDAALRSGIHRARGRWVVILDADLQDPPEALASLWPLRENHHVVFANRKGPYTTRQRHITSWLYRHLMRRVFGLPPGAGLYALLGQRAVDAICSCQDDPFVLMVVFANLGGPMTSVPVQRLPRSQGRSSYTSRMRMAKGVRTLGRSLLTRLRLSLPMSLPDPVTNDGDSIAQESALALQRSYFHTRRPLRMLVDSTPYIHRHFQEVTAVGGIKPGDRVCEWGAGLGRFSRLLAGLGITLDAIELSPTQARECRSSLEPWPQARVLEGDVAQVMKAGQDRYDVIVGFFMLHHLKGVDKYLEIAAHHLLPGGRIVFVEPNPWNPLYPIQITFTPGMAWDAERGIYELWPKKLRSFCHRAGFHNATVTRYGALPRAAYNWLDHAGLARLPEHLIPNLFKPFQILRADLGVHDQRQLT